MTSNSFCSSVKKNWKSVNICWIYEQVFGVLFFFDSRCTSYTQTRDDREWIFTFPFPLISMQSIPITISRSQTHWTMTIWRPYPVRPPEVGVLSKRLNGSSCFRRRNLLRAISRLVATEKRHPSAHPNCSIAVSDSDIIIQTCSPAPSNVGIWRRKARFCRGGCVGAMCPYRTRGTSPAQGG